MNKPLHPDTELIHAGEGASVSAKPVTTPIYSSSTFEFGSAADVSADRPIWFNVTVVVK